MYRTWPDKIFPRMGKDVLDRLTTVGGAPRQTKVTIVGKNQIYDPPSPAMPRRTKTPWTRTPPSPL